MAFGWITLRSGDRISLVRSFPFFAVHLACLAAFFLKFHWSYLIVCLAMYYVRMFFVTAGYHRYFSHRSFKTSRYSDTDDDLHSPSLRGFLWSHVGWILSDRYNNTKVDLIGDFNKYPELRWLNKYHVVPPVIFAVLMFLVGGWGMLVWGYCISTVILWHSSFTINSLSHIFGHRRYPTADSSKNNAILALVTMGEGWHNNHHHYMASARQGFFWWEVDITYYVLKVLSWFRIVWDLRQPPRHVLLGSEASTMVTAAD
jgi:stearoyl-CoA desaturase (delta-9 desaturase)